MRTIIHWFRRDLRVTDNTSLGQAVRDADRVVPVFLLDDHYGDDPNVGPSRFRFLRESLEGLDRELSTLGSRLLLRRGPASLALPDLASEAQADAVYANVEIGLYPEARDREVEASLERARVRLRLFGDCLIVEPDSVRTDRGDPYTVYTPFVKKWRAAEKRRPEPAPSRVESPMLAGVPIEKVRAWRDLPADPLAPAGGQAAAAAALARFLEEGLDRYAAHRNRPDLDGTSRLSPHLHFGTISPRVLLAAAQDRALDRREAAAGSDRFLLELAWRDFYHHVLFHFPRVESESFRPEMDQLAWQDAPEALNAWKRGRTGYPFVDAAMRQLTSTHWMHNRARMVVASFLTKDLHVHWREGVAWFEHELADADLASNNGGWQWAAGSGTDAAPYFRIFNPVLQSKKFDPKGDYIARFLPELARVPREKIHEPWTLTLQEQREAGCRIGADYPNRIVEHDREREVALRMLQAQKAIGAAAPSTD